MNADVNYIKNHRGFTIINPRKIDLSKFVIYKFTHVDSKKVYIGKTININDRLSGHGAHRKDKYSYFANAIRRNGKQKFICEFLVECYDEPLLLKAETAFIKYYKSDERKYGYNLTEGGDGVTPNKQTRIKISKNRKGKYCGMQNHRFHKPNEKLILELYDKKLSVRQVKEQYVKIEKRKIGNNLITKVLKDNNITIRSKEEQLELSIKGKTVGEISEKALEASNKRFTKFQEPMKSFVIDCRVNKKMSLQAIRSEIRNKYNFIASERVIRQNLIEFDSFDSIRDAWNERQAKAATGRLLSQETKDKLSATIKKKLKSDPKYRKESIKRLRDGRKVFLENRQLVAASR